MNTAYETRRRRVEHTILVHKDKTFRKHFESNEWGARHVTAWNAGHPIATLCTALARYADDHRARYESSLGDDGVLGPAWLDMLRSIRTLLNGELGQLDGGTIDGLLYDMAEAAGFEREELDA
jgi:hypothetical protein